MKEYKDILDSDIRAYTRDLPERFSSNIKPEKIVLDKETNRRGFLIDVLESSLDLLDNPSESSALIRCRFSLEGMLRHFTESGGAGSEALTRLIGLGVIKDIPEVKVTNCFDYSGSSSIVPDIENRTIGCNIFFNANPPDETGAETHNSYSNGPLCSSEFTLNLSDTSAIKAYLIEQHKEYEDVMVRKYPDTYT